jgi:tetratricopeptide (TPR) repeat protein
VLLAAVVVALLAVGVRWDRASQEGAAVSPEPSAATSATMSQPAKPEAAHFVGGRLCAQCHASQAALWKGSQHDLAMQVADDQTVLGDFDDAHISHGGVTSTFYKRDGKFYVSTDGPDGKLHDYLIKYTFGVAPLQQYLVEFPGGRLQALNIAWDTRPREAGGQRWFYLHPDEKITHEDPLHWTGMYQNWNSACAECHSTNVRKNYDPVTQRYATTWSDIDVSCEACHGPGSKHVAWAKDPGRWKGMKDKGLKVLLNERAGVQWLRVGETATARRSRPRTTSVELETCAHCHARRSPITDVYQPGKPFGDSYHLQLLTRGSYYPDGQIEDEVYVYGSFLQSRMNHAGVTCSDCHDPHSLKLRVAGNGVCLQCHAASRYATAQHHHHEPGSPGSRCVDCHMPARKYMVVDPRRDHSLRIPRPDLSVKLGTPNACSKCHADRSAQWAADQVRRWYGGTPVGFQTYAEAFHAARVGHPAAGELLAAVARDVNAPGIARATAILELGGYLSPDTVDALRLGVEAKDPLVRAAAADALEALPPSRRLALGAPLLNDPVRDVRIEAARALGPVPQNLLSAEQRRKLDAAIAEFVSAQNASAERPEGHVSLGTFYAQRGQFRDAIAELRKAIALQPYFAAAYVNLADVYRAQGQDERGEVVLRDALKRLPDDAGVHHALGLLLVRQKDYEQAEKELQAAAQAAPDNAHYSYVYAVALNGLGKRRAALDTLESARKRHPDNRELLMALVAFNRDQGNWDQAEHYAQTLVALAPKDPQLRGLLVRLQRQRAAASQ